MRKGGLAAWSIKHPVSTVMLTLTAVVLGFFALGRLSIDLLPHLIYPQIRVRVLDPGVSATLMEDRITRQLEEQLAITEDAVSVESSSSEGNASVSLQFEYGKDIDVALRDASTRLDRAKRFLPTTIEAPIIYKFDPSQIPVMEFIVSSPLRTLVDLRAWTDDVFAKQFLNLPGVAAAEVGGGVLREIHVLPDQRRLAGLGLSVNDVIQAIKKGNEDIPAGRLLMADQEFNSRTAGRLNSVAAIAALPIRLASGESIALSEVARVIDTNEEERIRVRYNGVPGVKLSIQKQPNANTVEVVDHVMARLGWLRANGLAPVDINVDAVADQSIYIRHSLTNASMAAISGAALAMVVIYLFLGNVRGTLIIGSAIPISIMVTFVIMALGGLTLNIMTLGGLALGVGMLVDNTIVMLENIARHQGMPQHQSGASPRSPLRLEAAVEAAGEVNSAIVASTTTNLAAVLPFLFISGLVGLLFRELIFTISAAILASLIVALTLVPSLAARTSGISRGRLYNAVNKLMAGAQGVYTAIIERVLSLPAGIVIVMVLLLTVSLFPFLSSKQEFLPVMDDGQIRIDVTTDPGVSLDVMDRGVATLERVISEQGNVEGVYSLLGGSIFGRTERETANRSYIRIQLAPLAVRGLSSNEWIKGFNNALAKEQLAGFKVRARTTGVRGLRTGRSDDDLSVRIQGPDLDALARVGDDVVHRLQDLKGVRNLRHSSEEARHEFAIQIDRHRAAELGIDVADVGRALRIALDGLVVSDFIQGDRSYDIRVRLPRIDVSSPDALGAILLFGETNTRPAVYLRDVAAVELAPVPAEILRENQRRMVEITGSLTGDVTLGEVIEKARASLRDIALPPGYHLYFGGVYETLEQSRNLTRILIGLALFLVFVVMAVQYESLRNPVIIILSVPFALIGVAAGLTITGLPLSMPVWLGVIMLVGIVVNNAIVLVEYIEIMREKGRAVHAAIVEAARLRLRPVLMTTLTTAIGMSPLAVGLGEGAEMLQPLAVTIVSGLLVAMFVTLLLVPAVYYLVHSRDATAPVS